MQFVLVATYDLIFSQYAPQLAILVLSFFLNRVLLKEYTYLCKFSIHLYLFYLLKINQTQINWGFQYLELFITWEMARPSHWPISCGMKNLINLSVDGNCHINYLRLGIPRYPVIKYLGYI